MARPRAQTKYTVQNILNSSYDEDFETLVFSPLGFDGVTTQRLNADNLATKITVSGSITYVAKAAPGTLQADALWQAKKIDETTGTIITFADGNSNYDNVATDLTALTYS